MARTTYSPLALLNAWLDDRCTSRAAALSFFAIFSLAPILLLLIVITGHFVGSASVVNQITSITQQLVGPSTAGLLHNMLVNVRWQNANGWPATLALAMFLIGATSAFDELKESLDDIWGTRKNSSGTLRAIWSRILAFILIGFLALLVLASVSLDAFLKLLSDNVLAMFGLAKLEIFRSLSLLITTGLIGLFFLLIFKWLPAARVSWREARHVSILATALFLIGHFAIRLYIKSSHGLSVYGAAGSLVVLLLWVYYSAAILFLSAEIGKLWWGIGER
ncbi:MAG TPA: YihY/virulence factor BrkB family protein [Burkholderiales bacterium]|nr:YihY/virulence factor BrkB family protein [Burkholderiales bacterium]